jgi:RNA polymerase sigma factor (sigma-70 family)
MANGSAQGDRSAELAKAAREVHARYHWAAVSIDELIAEVQRLPRELVERVAPAKCALLAYSRLLYARTSPRPEHPQIALAYTDLFNYLYHTAGRFWSDMPPQTAEDLAQGAIELVFKQHGKCLSPEGFLSFATFKLRHVAKKVIKGWRHEAANAPALELAVSDSQSPAALFERREALDALLSGLVTLKPRPQAILVLTYLDGLDDAAIGERLKMRPNTVSVTRFRAIQKLRQHAPLRAMFLAPLEDAIVGGPQT